MPEYTSRDWAQEIKVDVDRCIGCMACMDACFADVIRWDEQARRPTVAYLEDCVWCLACECVCPVQIIEVIPRIPTPLRSSF